MTALFFVFGAGLTVMALVLSFFGLRSERFPDSRGVYAGALGFMGALVVASCAFAVVLSREEQEERREAVAEFRAEEAEAAEAEAGSESPPAEEPQGPEPKPGDPLALTSPEDGSLIFDPTTLTASAGEVVVEYTNPSPVPHNVAIESGSETLAQGATVMGGETGDATAEIEAGEYVYYCSIPGHRESGMEGTLTVE